MLNTFNHVKEVHRYMYNVEQQAYCIPYISLPSRFSVI